MKIIYKLIVFALLIFSAIFLFTYCTKTTVPKILGVKIYELDEPASSLIRQWKDIGINTAFVGEKVAYNESFMKLAEKKHIDVFVIFPVFFNPDVLKEDSNLYAINNKGLPAKESWVEFVCPSRKEYQNYMIKKAADIVKETNPDGISIDFIRHFAFWEMIAPEYPFDSIPESCFCDNCIQNFQTDTDIDLPHVFENKEERAEWIRHNLRNEWTLWKSAQITSFVEKFTKELKIIKPGLKFNLHAIPWRKDDYNGAQMHIAGQDIKALSEFVDYISPMCYTFMLHRPPAWINSLTDDFSQQGATSILPSIQVKECYRDDTFELDEFKECIAEALKEPSKGIIFWSWDYIKQEPEKREAIKQFLKKL